MTTLPSAASKTTARTTELHSQWVPEYLSLMIRRTERESRTTSFAWARIKTRMLFRDVSPCGICPENLPKSFLRSICARPLTEVHGSTYKKTLNSRRRSHSIKINEILHKIADASCRCHSIQEYSLPVLLRSKEQWTIETQDVAINTCIVLRLSTSLFPR